MARYPHITPWSISGISLKSVIKETARGTFPVYEGIRKSYLTF